MAIVWILLGLTISIWSATFPFGGRKAPGPGFLPLILGLILMLLGSILLFKAIKREEGDPIGAPIPFVSAQASLTRVVLATGGMLAAAALLYPLGFFSTIFCLMFFLKYSLQPQRLKVAVIYALLSALGSSVLFRSLLKTPLPGGFLGF